MGNPGVASTNNAFEVNFIMTTGLELGKKIQTVGEGSKDSNIGPKIDTEVSKHEWGYDPETKKGIRVRNLNGRKVQEEGNAKIMKQEYDIRIQKEKSKENER